eukprot:48517_3
MSVYLHARVAWEREFAQRTERRADTTAIHPTFTELSRTIVAFGVVVIGVVGGDGMRVGACVCSGAVVRAGAVLHVVPHHPRALHHGHAHDRALLPGKISLIHTSPAAAWNRYCDDHDLNLDLSCVFMCLCVAGRHLFLRSLLWQREAGGAQYPLRLHRARYESTSLPASRALARKNIIFVFKITRIIRSCVVVCLPGIGVDDVYVFLDAFKQSRNAPTLKQAFGAAFSRSARAMFVTSFTTALAFLVRIYIFICAHVHGTSIRILRMAGFCCIYVYDLCLDLFFRPIFRRSPSSRSRSLWRRWWWSTMCSPSPSLWPPPSGACTHIYP